MTELRRFSVAQLLIFYSVCIAAVLALYSVHPLAQTNTKEILLWPNGAPGALGDQPADKPSITPYLSTAVKPTGSAIVVCPGGGYVRLAEHEGRPVAEWLNSIGVQAFVLQSRLGSSGYRHPTMLQDVQRAIRYVRSHAGEFGIDPHRIGILGFSAGGHVASSAGTHFALGNSSSSDTVERVSSRPDLMVLIYPVITMGKFGHAGSRDNLLGKEPSPEAVDLMSNEKQVTKDTAPAFLVHPENDSTVPVENSLMFAESLRQAGVGFELHVFEKGPKHGFGLALADPLVSAWPKLCEQWLRRHGF